jgi:hypothetical protein
VPVLALSGESNSHSVSSLIASDIITNFFERNNIISSHIYLNTHHFFCDKPSGFSRNERYPLLCPEPTWESVIPTEALSVGRLKSLDENIKQQLRKMFNSLVVLSRTEKKSVAKKV